MKRTVALLAACLALSAGRSRARADAVVLKAGERIEGRVLNPKCRSCGGSGRIACPDCAAAREAARPPAPCPTCGGLGTVACKDCGGLGVSGDKVVLQVRAGTVEFPRGDVQSIEWRPVDPEKTLSPEEQYRRALADLEAGNAGANFEMGAWCLRAGLDEEARRHLEAAVKLDPALAPRAEPLLAEAARCAEARALKALLAALAVFERDPAAGAAALRAFQKTHARTELARRAELQRDVIRRSRPALAAAEADTVEGLLRAAADRAAAACPECHGAGHAACPTCKGTTLGSCPVCAGSGQERCPVCAGSGRLTCPLCYGTGKYAGGNLGYPITRTCPRCGGAKEVVCDVCEGAGKRPCKRCGASGKVAGACPDCAGLGRALCAACKGTGVRPVERFTWGPPPVRQAGAVSVVGPGAAWRAWQGERDGAVITVVPARTIYRSALSRRVELAAGRRLQVLAVAVDNTRGEKLLRFRTAGGALCAVSREHKQSDALDLAGLLAAKAGDEQVRLILAHAGGADCAPKAYKCALAALAEDADLEALEAFHWVPAASAEAVKLAPVWLSGDEVEKLRASLR